MGLEEGDVLVPGRVEDNVRTVSRNELRGAGVVTDIGEHGDGCVEPVRARQRHGEIDHPSFRIIGKHDGPGLQPCDALGEPRAEEARSARDQDSGALDVLCEFLGSDAVDEAAEERLRVRLVCDLEAT
jgi:hypothetical protein